jgi:ubiquinone/menaquinone biosynthesis C-methylase UbiE
MQRDAQREHVPRERKFGERDTTSWEHVADWYISWVGKDGGQHHRAVTIPAALALLDPRPGERILDVGAGPGVSAPAIIASGAEYVGVDVSESLLRFARRQHGPPARFVRADARKLSEAPDLKGLTFDAALFLLSLQDMDPLAAVMRSVDQILTSRGRIVVVMTHPCFRVPRLSGWGWDESHQLKYRRIDRYLSPLAVPMETGGGPAARAITVRYHRPLEQYVASLAEVGLMIDRLFEIPGFQPRPTGPRARAESFALQEIPMFLGLRARKA